MTETVDDNIVRRETTQEGTIPADPFFSIFNFCHPVEEDDNGSVRLMEKLSLSDALLLSTPEHDSAEGSLELAIKRELCLSFGRQALECVELFASSKLDA